MSFAPTSTSTSTSSNSIHEIGNLKSRRLLLHNPLYQPQNNSQISSSSSSSDQYPGDNSFDANVVMVLSVLLCALICSLGLNSIIKCALRCSTFVSSSDASRTGSGSPNNINNNNNNNNSNSSSSAAAGSSNTGVKKKALKTFPTVSYSADLKLPGLETECVICLSDFAPGDRVRLLPTCNHGFHLRCIDKWLSSHSSCPKCRHNLIETCQKIVAAAATSSQLQQTILSITPLESEPFTRNYRGTTPS